MNGESEKYDYHSCCSRNCLFSEADSDSDDNIEHEKKDVEALERHLENIKYKMPKGARRIPWIETLSIVVNRSIQDEKIDASEDFRRESKL